MLPTLAHLADAKLPENPIDGKDVWDLISGKRGATNPHEYYAFSTGPNLEAVMTGDGKWKLHVPHKYRTLVRAGNDGMPGEYRTTEIGLSLYDMKNDPYEKNNALEQHPEIARRLLAFAEEHRREFYPETPPFPRL
jgi:hypothetical protein